MGGFALSDKQHLSNKPRNPDPMLQYGSIILCTKVQYQKYMEFKYDMKPPNPILHIQSQTKVKICYIYYYLQYLMISDSNCAEDAETKEKYFNFNSSASSFWCRSGSLQKWLECFNNNAHIGPKFSFILHTKCCYSCKLHNQ